MKFIVNDVPPRAAWALQQAGIHPLLARLYAARGITAADELDDSLSRLLPPETLKGAAAAARLLADAIAAQQHLCIVADYDCDGATACAVALRGLALLGAQRLSYLVPDRLVDGYGLTPPIAQRVKALGADLLMTVDNGIASVQGIAAARALGLKTLVTDHHLPATAMPWDAMTSIVGATVSTPQNDQNTSFSPNPPEADATNADGAATVCLPDADAIVNPNQPGCGFASKALAGVGVMFYVLLALRAERRARGAFEDTPQPRLDALLPLVALGTVADVVRLDANNRRLVAQGLKRIRAGQLPVGLAALFTAAGRKTETASAADFGFAIGPRINAAGRLADMTLGIELLTTDDARRAGELARQLDAINRERRDIEGGMRQQALALAESLFEQGAAPPPAFTVFDPSFHEGVAGIVAARIKDKLHRPAFVFAASSAPGQQQMLKGSGRSIEGFHLRDALDLMAKRHPGLLLRFGGHAMAAGCTIGQNGLETFTQALRQIAEQWLDAATLQRRLLTDGPLPPQYRRPDLAHELQRGVWGQGFAAPVFSEELEVLGQRLVGQRHLALKLKHQGQPVDGIWFGRTAPLPARARLAYRLEVDDWQGQQRVRFLIENAETL